MNRDRVGRSIAALPLGVATLLFVGLSRVPEASAQTEGDPRQTDVVEVGTIEVAFDGERRVFTLLGPATGEYEWDHWGSGWMSQANVLGAMLWGVEGSVEDARRAHNALVIHLSFWLRGDGDFVVEPLSQRCHSMDNYAELSEGGLGGENIILGEDECGGIAIDVIRFEEDDNVYVIEGRFSGRMNRGEGAAISDGVFRARLSEYSS